MQEDGIRLKGEKEGVNLIINLSVFTSMESLIEALRNKLTKGRKFYKGANVKITTDLKLLEPREIRVIKEFLFEEFLINECSFIDIKDSDKKVFSGVTEGRTKFIRKTVRSGQKIEYVGNLVIVGDVNPGAEVYAGGNIIVLGELHGSVHAGYSGNNNAMIAAFKLTPQIMQIAGLVTISPEDMEKPSYPELAKIKNGNIVVEPYSVNKYI